MKLKRIVRTILAIGLVVLLLPVYALAQFGFGGIVSDPIQEAHSAEQLVHEIQQGATTAQILQTTLSLFQTTTNLWQQAQTEAQMFQNKNAFQFRNMIMQLSQTFVSSEGPIAAPWAQTIMTGVGAPGAWGNTAIEAQINPLAVIQPGSPLYAEWATAQIGAGSTMDAIQTIGNANTAAFNMAPAISSCQQSATATDPLDNGNDAEIGIGNACTSLIVQQGQNARLVDTARLELDAIQAKQTSDNLAEYATMVSTAAAYQTLPSPFSQAAANDMLVPDR